MLSETNGGSRAQHRTPHTAPHTIKTERKIVTQKCAFSSNPKEDRSKVELLKSQVTTHGLK